MVNTADGTIAAHYEYDPFGNLNYSSGSYADENSFKFSTKYHDEETGLLYYGYRYYDPELGRWISRDPSGENSGSNLYAFILNDGINRLDYLGLFDTSGYNSYLDFGNSLKTPINGPLTIDGEIDPFLYALLDAAASGNVGYTWKSPPIPFGPGGIATLGFKATVSGQMVDCFDTTAKTFRKKGMFEGSFVVSGNAGIGYLDDSGKGGGFGFGPSDKCKPCKTDIGELVFDLSAVAGAGTGKVGWSMLWSKSIGQCSARAGCRWTFTAESSKLQVGVGARGARIAVVGSGTTKGTVSTYDINWK